MPQEYIEIHGARENNLKNVSLRIPKRKITIFTGVSGSGKSSIVFDTIASESRRLLNENFSMFVRNFLPKYSQPDAKLDDGNMWAASFALAKLTSAEEAKITALVKKAVS
jgi:excinuclease UvrABC ATPase subunit